MAVGTPETIARQMAEVIHDGDFDWIAMYFPDYIADLDTFGREVMPLLPHTASTQPSDSRLAPPIGVSNLAGRELGPTISRRGRDMLVWCSVLVRGPADSDRRRRRRPVERGFI